MHAHPVTQVAAALIRRGDEVLLVRQQGPNDPASSWALPSGVVEAGELLTEALVREVREEAGLEVLAPGRLLYVVQLDNPLKQQLRHIPGPEPSYQSTAFVFEIDAWKGGCSGGSTREGVAREVSKGKGGVAGRGGAQKKRCNGGSIKEAGTGAARRCRARPSPPASPPLAAGPPVAPQRCWPPRTAPPAAPPPPAAASSGPRHRR